MTIMISLLYVDDEQDLLEIGRLFLEQTGDITVSTVLSATSALTLLEENHFDAVLSDYQMPEMDGLRFLHILRGRGDAIPFIIFTGRGREEIILQALNTGVDFYIQKGDDPGSQFAELANLVRKAVSQRRAAAALVASEAQYRSILQNIQDAYYRSDRDGNLILASPSLLKVLGYNSLAEVYGKNIPHTFYADPDSREGLLAEIDEHGSVTDYEVKLKKRDGTVVYVATSSHKYFDELGNYLGVEGIFRDITEKKQADDKLRLAYDHIAAAEEQLRAQFDELRYGQDALRTSERTLQGIVQGSPIPQFVIDKNHRVISWNSALERHSGIKATDVLGTTGQWRAFYPSERPCMADLLVDRRPDQVPAWYAGKFNPSKYVEGAFEATDFFPHMGENETWLHFTASPILDSDGTIIGAVETLEDISDWKQAQEEILALNRFQHSIIDNANVWIMVIDEKGTVLLWNNAAAEIRGYSPEEVLHGNAIWKLLYPDPEYRKTITATILRIIRERQFLRNFDTSIRTKNGAIKTLLWNTRSLDDSPGDLGRTYVAIGVDITKSLLAEQAYRDSENRMAAILRGSPIPQFVIDRNHRVIHWNTALEKYSGIPADEVIGTTGQWRAFYPHERPCLADVVIDSAHGSPAEWYAGKYKQSSLIEGAFEATDFFPHMGKSGTWLYFTAAPIRDPDGTIIGAVETLEDISDTRRAQESLTQINRKLNLLSSITRHDILNQITALSGYTDLLLQHISDPKDIRYLDQCMTAIRNIERQITFTRLYEDLGVNNPSSQNAGELIRRAISELPGVPARVEPALDSVEIYADPLLAKVFYNLVDNAQQHGKKITQVRFSHRRSPDSLVILCEDDGIGIPADEKEQIFRKGFGKHTGLGLFLVREILAITGISITETGIAGNGARFEIQVPAGIHRILT